LRKFHGSRHFPSSTTCGLLSNFAPSPSLPSHPRDAVHHPLWHRERWREPRGQRKDSGRDRSRRLIPICLAAETLAFVLGGCFFFERERERWGGGGFSAGLPGAAPYQARRPRRWPRTDGKEKAKGGTSITNKVRFRKLAEGILGSRKWPETDCSKRVGYFGLPRSGQPGSASKTKKTRRLRQVLFVKTHCRTSRGRIARREAAKLCGKDLKSLNQRSASILQPRSTFSRRRQFWMLYTGPFR